MKVSLRIFDVYHIMVIIRLQWFQGALQYTVAEALKDYNPDAPEAEQRSYLETLEARLKAAGMPERLARIPTASPDLLGVILKEGKV